MDAVPQLAALTSERSMLVAAGRARKSAAKNATPGAPIFGAPIRGMGALIETLTQRVTALGATIELNSRVHSITKSGKRYHVHTNDKQYECDAVVVASPARHSAPFINDLDSRASELLLRCPRKIGLHISQVAAIWFRNLTNAG